MTPLDWLTAATALFIVGMVWLRTRMHYPRGRERLLLTRAGEQQSDRKSTRLNSSHT